MDHSINLAVDVDGDPDRVFEILSTTDGQRAFWTADCDVSADSARFGFEAAPVDLLVDVTAEPAKLVRMHVTSGFPFWEGSTWEWELGQATAPKPGPPCSSGTMASVRGTPRSTWLTQLRRGR